MWPPNSPDLNPVDYGIWEGLSGKVYRQKIRDINNLRDVLGQAWHDFPQNDINTIINQYLPQESRTPTEKKLKKYMRV